MWSKGRKKGDALLLKEAIIWIHHGIELSLKQLLVQTNEYLVFGMWMKLSASLHISGVSLAWMKPLYLICSNMEKVSIQSVFAN